MIFALFTQVKSRPWEYKIYCNSL